jgi:hypothetical protein
MYNQMQIFVFLTGKFFWCNGGIVLQIYKILCHGQSDIRCDGNVDKNLMFYDKIF